MAEKGGERTLSWKPNDEGYARILGRHRLLFNLDTVDIAARHRNETQADVRVRRNFLLGYHAVLQRRFRCELLNFGEQRGGHRMNIPDGAPTVGIWLRVRCN